MHFLALREVPHAAGSVMGNASPGLSSGSVVVSGLLQRPGTPAERLWSQLQTLAGMLGSLCWGRKQQYTQHLPREEAVSSGQPGLAQVLEWPRSVDPPSPNGAFLCPSGQIVGLGR